MKTKIEKTENGIKVIMDAADWKKICKAGVNVASEKTHMKDLINVLVFRVNGNVFTISAENTISRFEYSQTMDFEQEEEICLTVSYETIKKVADIKSEISLNINADSIVLTYGKRIIVLKSDVRKYSDMLDSIVEYSENYTPCMGISAAEFINGVNSLEKYASTQEVKPILTGLHINAEHMVVIDGYRAVIKNILDRKILNDNFSFTIHSYIFGIDNIFGKTGKLIISENKKTILVTDGEIKYYLRKLNGEYYNYKQVIPTSYKANILIDNNKSKSLYNTLKDIKKLTFVEKSKTAITLYCISNTLNLFARSNDIEIDEETEIECKLNNGILGGYNQKYLLEAMELFKNEECSLNYVGGELKPITITNDEYIAVILPLKLSDENKNRVQETINN